MGIKKFYRWLTERYPLCVMQHNADNMPDIDNFYIDVNGIIHREAKAPTMEGNLPYLVPSKTFEDIMKSILAYMEALFQRVLPKKVLYIAIDGVAPRAKMTDQRNGRYEKAQSNAEFITQQTSMGQEVPLDFFDGNAISPGTQFMIRLNAEIKNFISYKIATDTRWQGIDVVFSGVDVPGEGEHNIMRYIRENKGQPNVRHCIYSNDADLVMLALISHEPYLVLIREEAHYGRQGRPLRKIYPSKPSFDIFFLNILREYLQAEFSQVPDFERFIHDFVLLCFFVGNDFLPNAPTVEIGSNSLEWIFEVYRQNFDDYLVSSCGRYINWPMFAKYMSCFNAHELQNIERKIESEQRPPRPPIVEPHIATPKLSSVTLPGNDTLSEIKSWYYAEKCDSRTPEEAKKFQCDYLRGLQWVLLYYTEGCPDQRWYYPYHYAPFLSDLGEVAISLETDPPQFHDSEIVSPVVQLVTMLPPQSMSLLPQTYRELYKNERLSKYFPERVLFEYDPLAYMESWQSLKRVLPLVDIEDVIEEVNRIPAEDTSINHVTKDILFRHDPQVTPKTNSLTKYYCEFSAQIHEEFVTNLNDVNFDPIKCEGMAATIPGFPSLSYIDIENVRQDNIGVNLYGNQSRTSSLVITPRVPDVLLAEVHQQLEDSVVYIDYPSQKMARVVAVFNPAEILPPLMPGQLSQKHANYNDYEFWCSVSGLCKSHCNKKLGIDLTVDIIVAVQQLNMYKKSSDGRWLPNWYRQIWFVPLQLIMTERMIGHHRDPPYGVSFEEEYQIGRNVVLISADLFGSCAQIIGHSADDLIVNVTQRPLIIDVHSVAAQRPGEWSSAGRIAQILNLDPEHGDRTVDLLATNLLIPIFVESQKFLYQYGLNLVHERQGHRVRGFSEYNKTIEKWEYSEEAVNIFIEYFQKFPEFIQALDRNVAEKVEAGLEVWKQSEQLFTYSQDYVSEARRIARWILAHPSQKPAFYPPSASHVGGKVIEKLADVKFARSQLTLPDGIVIPPSQVIMETRPWTAPSTKECQFVPGDRVVNLCSQDDTYIPFGTEGTVTGTWRSQVEVLWDIPILDSNPVDVFKRTLLNLSQREEVLGVSWLNPEEVKEFIPTSNSENRHTN